MFQEYDKKTIEALLEDNELKERVCVVLTKCDKDRKDRSTSEALKGTIKDELSKPIDIFCVSNNEKLPLDMEKLIEWSGEQLDDDDMKEAFIRSQIISLKAKRTSAGKVIALYSAAAAGIGAIPIQIPIADAAILTPLQIAMTTQIINSYGLVSIEGMVKNVVSAVIIPTLGKNLASYLIKIIPVVGNVVNAAVASTITAALGCAVSQICFECCKKIAEGKTVDFKQEFNGEAIEKGFKYFMDNNNQKKDYMSNHTPNKNKSDAIAKKYITDNNKK